MMKIINAYKQYERLTNCRMPEFSSNTTEFHVTLLNMNYDEGAREGDEFTKKFTKELVKASRLIYKLILHNPRISITQISESIGLSRRQVLKYMKAITRSKKITRVGERKTGYWKITDEEYDSFFDRLTEMP